MPLRKKSPVRLNRDAERLISLSTGLVTARSRMESLRWETAIMSLLDKLMASGSDATLMAALDHTTQSNPQAHEALASLCEASAESCTILADGQPWDTMLLAIPMVAWSKYAIPSGALTGSGLKSFENLFPQLHAHVLSAGARLCIAPYLFSVDQIPPDFSGVRKFTHVLGEAAVKQQAAKGLPSKEIEAAPLLADTRFLLAGIAAPSGEALFRWQETDAHTTRSECLQRWTEQGRPHLAPLLHGCEFEGLLPDAFFAACSEAEKKVRPLAVRAATSFLQATLQMGPDALHAVVAGVGETEIREFRIGLLRRGHPGVVDGVLWPILGDEEDAELQAHQAIDNVLQECKIGEVTRLSEMLAPEYCEDCGAPLFPNADGEMLHPELPEEAEMPNTHFH